MVAINNNYIWKAANFSKATQGTVTMQFIEDINKSKKFRETTQIKTFNRDNIKFERRKGKLYLVILEDREKSFSRQGRRSIKSYRILGGGAANSIRYIYPPVSAFVP